MLYTSDFALNTIQTAKKLMFLAGSIDLQLSGNWRKSIANKLCDQFDFFDPTAIHHETLTASQWKQHIKWELEAMEKVDVILMNFLPSAKSPISLVELGLNTRGKKLVVICPNEFYKKQYINALCEHYSTPLFGDENEAIEHIKNILCNFYTN